MLSEAREEIAVVNVLFVCLGNICRSPAAEGVLRALAQREGLGDAIHADSAATHDYHTGRRPDRRACDAAGKRGIDIAGHRARRTKAADFCRFDYVLAMDQWNLVDLRRICPPAALDRLHRFLDFASEAPLRDVPDPYHGGPRDFEEMMDLLELGARGLLRHIREHIHEHHGSGSR